MPGNVRLFLAFRVLFNARFYYPVLAVLFVDLGLTLDQYAMLNVAWAVSIVCFELPLGAVADKIGRRPLVVGAAALMVVEMAVLAFAPTGNPTLLFWVFMVNRVLSGLAEAAASGADEALAYDTLCEVGRQDEWPKVLSSLQYLMSGAFILSMVIGAAVYDPDLVNRIAGTALDQKATARFPVYLTLLMSLGALAVALRMREPKLGDAPSETGWRGVVAAARWIVATRFALCVILFVLVLDSAIRLFLTLVSGYYRLIGIPEGAFGLLGAVFAGMGFFIPRLARGMVERRSGIANFLVVTLVMFAGLVGAALARNWSGVLFVMLMSAGFGLLNFFSSYYLNAATESSRRATVLSFRSLSGNLMYGLSGWLYALLFVAVAGGERPPSGSPEEMAVLGDTLIWIPVAFGAAIVPVFLYSLRSKRLCSK